MSPWLLLLLPLLVIGVLFYRRRAKRQRRSSLLATPLTPEQRETVEQLVPITRRLPAPLRPKLEGKMNLLLDQVTFRGHNGIEVDEAMKLSIAAQACLLVVNSPVWYDTLRNVLIYPSGFRTRRNTHDGLVVHERNLGTLGESWTRGPVVLSWDHALHGGLDDRDGHNVVIHEFAHQLDSLTGHANGIPILRKGQAYVAWEKAMLSALAEHQERTERGDATVIDAYGATNHEEFFAEAIVAFFEKAQALRSEHAALYSQLSQLLALDPAEWH
jgi:Mlc titration factor MtfA (ptsG expression regulator)